MTDVLTRSLRNLFSNFPLLADFFMTTVFAMPEPVFDRSMLCVMVETSPVLLLLLRALILQFPLRSY